MTQMMRAWSTLTVVATVGVVLTCGGPAVGQVDFSVYRSLGDSLTHGTQGGKVVDYRSQPQAYPVLLAEQMGTSFELPLLTQAFGQDKQSRLDAPNFGYGANLAVNGATLHDALYRTADPLTGPDYASGDRTDLVLAPRTGATQVSAAVADGATFTTIWLGGNDFLNTMTKYGTVLSDFLAQLGISLPADPLNVTDVTGQASFAADYAELMNQIMAVPGMKTAVANFPEMRHIAGVMDKAELTALIGPNPMPEDAMTSELMAAALLFDDVSFWGKEVWTPDMLTNPDNYWDASEVAVIDSALNGFNATIAEQAALHDVALVDIRTAFEDIAEDGILIGDWEVNADWFVANLGEKKASLYSSDGAHPSDIGHALIANAFIEGINDHYGTDLEPLSDARLRDILDNDKFVDNDLDGKIEGLAAAGVPYLAVNTFTPDYTGDDPEIPVPEPTGLAMLLVATIVGGTKRRR